MSSDPLSFPNIYRPTRSLTGLYIKVSCCYVLMVWVLWSLGLEGIYRHPFPFYAFIYPIFTNFSVTNVVMGTALTAAILSGAAGLLALAMDHWRWFEQELDRRQTVRLLTGLVIFAFVFSAAVAMLRGGIVGITQAYDRQAYEYIGDIGTGGSIRGLFTDYVKYHQYLSMHAKVHPPGPIAILWILSYLGGRAPLGLSIATMAFGALGVVPMYLWVREMFAQRVALTCAILYTLVPSVVIFTATSADITFMPFTITTLFLFYRAIKRGSVRYAFAAGVMYGVLSLISFSLISIGVFFGLIGLLRLKDPKTRRAVFQTAAVMIAGVFAIHFLVRVWSGFDVFEVFRMSREQFDTDQMNLDIYDPRMAAWAWKFANPICWFFFAGIPISVLFIRRVWSAEAGSRAIFWVFVLTLLALDILYLARGEGERSAMYVMPFVVVPAGHLLDEIGSESGSAGPLLATAVFLGFQSWAIESVLYTYW